jgi:hypothetical protein
MLISDRVKSELLERVEILEEWLEKAHSAIERGMPVQLLGADTVAKQLRHIVEQPAAYERVPDEVVHLNDEQSRAAQDFLDNLENNDET